MKKSLVILILIISNSCNPSPTYNAFDDIFDISIRDLKNDGYDKISVGCGYYNLQQKEGRLRNYYQVYVDDLNNVVAKGFVYFLDTLKVKENMGFKELCSTVIDNENIIDLNNNLKKYGYKFSRQVKYEYGSFVEIIDQKLKDTIKLNLSLRRLNGIDSIISRELDYFISKPK
ncbi:hypothetical protein [Tenacibaculum xiamenense]|uniref:hypothetical protein n=1 Tax=Tenacibaculum xiamenense TaxID=1261553 RepID=UPI003893593E